MQANQVEDEGFVPLTKKLSSTGRSTNLNRQNSFNAETGERENLQSVWESGSWSRLEKGKGRLLEKANSFIGGPSANNGVKASEGAVVIVDPFSTGAHLAKAVCEAGFKCARVFSIWNSPVAALVQEGITADFSATVQHNDQLEDQDAATNDTVARLRALPFPIIAVIPGAETGVELADRLSHRMGLRSNGEEGSLARRNKFLMGERVRDAGVRAVVQRMCESLGDLNDFLDQLEKTKGSCKCVVKPVQSAGTDDVFLCDGREQAEKAFSVISGKINGLGLVNHGALAQEFLEGKEYVIDKVSKDGVHKICAIWEYDKRSVNNSHFVYFGMRLMGTESAKSQEMLKYADKVLDALGIVQGPSHMEMIYQADGPCLVEVGSRCHGGEGTWLPVVKECLGFTIVEAVLDLYTDGRGFDKMDANNYKKMKAGRDVDMVSRMSGVIRSMPGDKVIRALPSFRSISWEVKPGDYAKTTIDCFTRPGCVQLVNVDEEQAEKDLEAIHNLEPLGLFDYSVICPTPPVIGAVVIVDPFSSGINLAAMVLKWGFKLIIVFSSKDKNTSTTKLVSSEGLLSPTLIIMHASDKDELKEEVALKETLAALSSQTAPVLAILPGCNTGEALAEKLSVRFGTRNNGEQLIKTRRNKYLVQDLLKSKGIRSLTQTLARSEQEAVDFFTTNNNKVVVKPNCSTGNDSVSIAASLDEVKIAFAKINGQLNVLGEINDGCLLQEKLDGTNYIVDAVSRDGVYKVTALWEVDSRYINNNNSDVFVDFGKKLVNAFDKSSDGTTVINSKVKQLIEYSKSVSLALGILNGPSHMEVIVTGSGPVLVDVSCSAHPSSTAGEASWIYLAQDCIGYHQLDATLSCFLRPDRFDHLPLAPSLLRNGREVYLIHRDRSAPLKDVPGIASLRSLKSFKRVDLMIQPGDRVIPTVNRFTSPGSAQLVHEKSEVVDEDYASVRELESEGKIFSFSD